MGSLEQYIEGLYSFPSVNSKVSDRSLAESIDDKLFFAGEATEPIHFATMHGAVNSGYRAANEALSKF